MVCLTCGRDFTYSRSQGHRKTKCNSCSVREHRRRKKIRAVKYKGGKCVRCNYDRCMSALEFHHRENDKDFGLASGTGWCRSWNRIQEELDKCDLLCSNCHIEIHNDF